MKVKLLKKIRKDWMFVYNNEYFSKLSNIAIVKKNYSDYYTLDFLYKIEQFAYIHGYISFDKKNSHELKRNIIKNKKKHA